MDQRTLLKFLLRLLRILGTIPYQLSNDKFVISQVYMGLSVATQLLRTIFYGLFNFPSAEMTSSNFYVTVLKFWPPVLSAVLMTVIWIFLAHTRVVMIIIKNVMNSNTQYIPVGISTYSMVAIFILDFIIAFHSGFSWPGDKVLMVFRFINNHTGFLALVSVTLLLHTAMNIVTSEINNLQRTLFLRRFSKCYRESKIVVRSASKIFPKTDKFKTTSLFPTLDLAMTTTENEVSTIKVAEKVLMSSRPNEFEKPEASATSRLENVRKELKTLRQTVSCTHKSFSAVALGVLVYEQLELLALALHGMYGDTKSCSAWQALFFSLKAVYQLCFIVDSQTDYRTACEEGVHRVKRLIAEVERLGPKHADEVWQLRGIQAELERMPRFTILGLFVLGRHCLLSMGSIVLTYVIIAVQFTTSSNPVTCKAVSCNCSLS
ncbi:Gustatory receptor 72 [Hyalella azteca]|uniref:Gustatory receptor 72 n=1 Tax=Hyalella azteca TaxID=294128 RepID=A0A6A0GRC4_HYAAZ|nr:Gustatory receptor 72 [Hyalella azteca]